MPLKKNTVPSSDGISRRSFVKNVSAAAAFTIVPRFVIGGNGFVAPSDTLYVAGIGVGGKGTVDLVGIAGKFPTYQRRWNLAVLQQRIMKTLPVDRKLVCHYCFGEYLLDLLFADNVAGRLIRP